MTTYRGVSIGGTNAPITGASINPTRSLLAEQSFGSAGEAKIYDGPLIVTGSIDAAYRSFAKDIIENIMGVMSGTVGSLTESIVVIGDENGGLSFATTAINAFDLSVTVKDYAKVKLDFVSSSIGTSVSISTVTDYTEDIPVSTTSQITCSNAGTYFSGITIHGEIPIDQDYYVIGEKTLHDIIQSQNGTLKGTLTLAATEWTGLLKACGACGDLGTITLVLNTSGAACVTSLIKTITIENAKIESGSASGQGRSRFDKTINWKAEVNSTTNESILS